ncbi:hypothetical protein C8R45DRAFT_604880 [Mycena sanguinolenta]|nr:hypothetical protein C8R45DRAFT_604880 [Mycena sanguinolenta]
MSQKTEPATAPLRAKIAQFESKGGVPKPRGKFDSFGSAAPPQQNKQRRELYGNRMKPVWVPTTKVGPSVARPRYERPEERAARTANEEKLTDNHLASPPESPTVENEHGSEHGNHLPSPPESPVDEDEDEHGSDPASPALILHQQEITVEEEQEAEEDVQHESRRQEYIYEIPEIRGESDEEDVDDEEPVENVAEASVSAAPAIDEWPPAVSIGAEPQITAVEQRPSSPPLPPSPLLPPTPPPLQAHATGLTRVDLHVDTGYGTISIHAPPRISSSEAPSPRSGSRSHFGHSTPSSTASSPRAGRYEPPSRTASSATSSPLAESPDESFAFSHTQGQTFSSVVYPRVHETPARKAPRLPLPASPSPKYPNNNRNNRISNAELLALVANAAALERKLVAGELPADVLKRLSVRPPPVTNTKVPVAMPVVVEERASRPETEERSSRGEKKVGGFRNALRGAARSKSRKREKDKDKDRGESESSHPPAPPHADSSTWFGDVNWRKLTSTSRHKSPPLESAPRTLISTP